jgi:iron complex transport system permease protein
VHVRPELVQGACVNAPLEVDDFVDGTPKRHPPNSVEFRLIPAIETQFRLFCDKTKNKPPLFLADAQWLGMLANVLVRKPVTQPIARYTEQLDVAGFQPDFFAQLPVHGTLGFFAPLHAALWKLPPFCTYAPAQKQLVLGVREDDADVGAKAFVVNPIVAHSNRAKTLTADYFTLSFAVRPRRLSLSAGRSGALFLALLSIVVASFAFALASGSADIGFLEAMRALRGAAPDPVQSLVTELRLPRALTAFAVGGLLAVAGVLMQVLLRNPLAEPYILGSSGGAAVAALTAMSIGLGSLAVDASAFGGAMAATLLVFAIAQGTGSWTPTRLLLTGVVLAAGFSAATTLILAMSPDQNLRGMLFWLMGDLSFAFEAARPLVLLALLVIVGTLGARHLNVLARGELQAAIVGLPVRQFRYLIFAAAALATALSVTTAGVIGFIGLVVPHLVRLVAGSDHRIVLPASALGGGALLVIADTLARTIMAPRQLPVGALTAAIGVPLFLVLMSRVRAERYR